MTVLGFDTSNYTTSVAIFDGASGREPIPPPTCEGGSLGSAPGRRLVCPCQKPAGPDRWAVFPCGPGVCGRRGSQYPAPGGGGVLYALLSGRGMPGSDGGSSAEGASGGGFSPAGASGGGPLVGRAAGAFCQPLSGMAPFRGHHRAPSTHSLRGGTWIAAALAAPQTFLPASSSTGRGSCWSCPSQRERPWTG